MTIKPLATRPNYEGVWPALLTPLKEDLAIDIDAFVAHAKLLLDAGCAGVTPFGTTGEGPSFSVAERIDAIDGLIAGGVPAERILVSTSCAALPDVVTLTRHAVQAGTYGCLVLPPFFLKNMPDDGIIDAYRWVIDKVADARLRIVLYHIPQIAGLGLSRHVVHTLLTQYPETIIGIKDSSGNRAGSLAFAKAFMPPLQVWVGNEPDLQTMAAVGSNGAVSGVGNVMPHLLQRLTGVVNSTNSSLTHQRDASRVQQFIDILNCYVMTSAFKGVMAVLTGNQGWRRVRPPLVALTEEEFFRLKQQLEVFSLDRNID
jgi:4-hydroxy-tetrahydrodipicolinate synthase